MYNTAEYQENSNYLGKSIIWQGYMPYSIFVVVKGWKLENEYGCSDSFALEINKAFAESEKPEHHTNYNTVEELLDSLDAN
jgi:hypothetical protein